MGACVTIIPRPRRGGNHSRLPLTLFASAASRQCHSCAGTTYDATFDNTTMTIDRNDIEEVLKQAEDTLYTAKLGLAHVLQKDAKARIAGLRNVIVFGRAVTNVLQRLRHLLPDFDAWYQPYVDQMEADPLMKFLYRLRSEILKEGSLHVHSSVRLSGDPTAILRQFRAPPRAKSFFVGDRIGGSGWRSKWRMDELRGITSNCRTVFQASTWTSTFTSLMHQPASETSQLQTSVNAT
jgi:hypothetical protein